MESTRLKSRGDYEEGGGSLFGKPPGLVAVLIGNAVVLVAAVVQGAVYYSMLPDELPAHFDWQGTGQLIKIIIFILFQSILFCVSWC
jgi:uncharacterized membrane protein